MNASKFYSWIINFFLDEKVTKPACQQARIKKSFKAILLRYTTQTVGKFISSCLLLVPRNAITKYLPLLLKKTSYKTKHYFLNFFISKNYL